MNTVSITKAKEKFFEIYEQVAKGKVFIITKWGRPVAKLIRYKEDKKQ